MNADDESYQIIKNVLSTKIYTYGFNGKSDFSKKLSPTAPMFNQYNYLAAYGVCRLLGISETAIQQSLASFTLPPGRLEEIHVNPTIVIDFAHTPNSFQQVLPAIRNKYLSSRGRLIHVFGSAAKRDASKRPLMGASSARYSDVIILTEEDYRTEDPLAITSQIANGIEEKLFQKVDSENLGSDSRKKFTVIIDRQKAIEKAISIAKKEDVVILTGKAHEKSLCRGKKEYPWDEKQAVLDAMKKITISN